MGKNISLGNRVLTSILAHPKKYMAGAALSFIALGWPAAVYVATDSLEMRNLNKEIASLRTGFNSVSELPPGYCYYVDPERPAYTTPSIFVENFSSSSKFDLFREMLALKPPKPDTSFKLGAVTIPHINVAPEAVLKPESCLDASGVEAEFERRLAEIFNNVGLQQFLEKNPDAVGRVAPNFFYENSYWRVTATPPPEPYPN